MENITKTISTIAIILVGLFFYQNSYAACSWTGNTGTVAAPYDIADYQACLTDAASKTGAVIIQIPACSLTWSGYATANMSSMTNVTSLTVQGAGGSLTTINNDSDPQYGAYPNSFRFIGSIDKKIRVTGFKFTGSSGVYITGNTSPVSPNTGGFRIDNNIWYNTSSAGRGIAIVGTGRTWGVIDSNTIDWNSQFSNVTGASSSYYGGNVAWNGSSPLGTGAAVYLEGNTATNHNIYNWMFVDTDSGASIVTRFNTLVNFHVIGHDNASQLARGQFTWEHYNNDSTSNYGSDGSSMSTINAQGGTGVIFNNIIRRTSSTSAFSFPGTKGIALKGARLGACAGSYRTDPWKKECNSNTKWYLCMGSNAGIGATECDPSSASACNNHPSECRAVDGSGSTNAPGYPCRDQIGVDNNLNPRPALLWNNTFVRASNIPVQAVAEVASCAANYIVKDRDYCEHATNMPSICNGITTTYKAFTCPHPLAGSSGSCDSSKAGTKGYNNESVIKSTILVSSTNGTVTSNPSGINCGLTCIADYNSDTSVTLNAAANSGYKFSGWSGACSGTGTCAVDMKEARFVQANYAQNTLYSLTVTKVNPTVGTVISSDNVINCGSTCSANLASGKSVTLTALPINTKWAKYRFAGWSGACSGTGTCTINMTAAKSVTATFYNINYKN